MKKLLTCVFALAAVISCFSETRYEAAVEKIYAKYYCLGTYGYNKGLDMSDALTLSFYGAEGAAYLALANYGMQYDLQTAERWSKQMEEEIANAASLMTAEDYHKLFLKTQFGQLSECVHDEFSTQFVKDEFETQTQYEARTKSIAIPEFDRICAKVLGNLNISVHLKISPKYYEAEMGAYRIEVEEFFNITGKKEISNKYETWLPMEPSIARGYKGEDIENKDILSIKWVVDETEIHAEDIIYIDYNGERKHFYAGHLEVEELIFDYDLFNDNNPIIPGHKWNSANLKNYIEIYKPKLQSALDSYNAKIEDSKYYMPIEDAMFTIAVCQYKFTPSNKYDKDALEAELEVLKSKMEIEYQEILRKIQNNCRDKRPDRYIEIYSSEHPDFKNNVTALAENYKCYQYTYNDFAFFVIDDKRPNVPTCHDKYIDLFNDEEEFASSYANINDFVDMVDKRSLLKKAFESYISRICKESTLAFRGANTDKPSTESGYIKALESFKEMDAWYTKALDACFIADTKMVKEFTKSGHIFADKAEFFAAYTSPNYKKILKSK